MKIKDMIKRNVKVIIAFIIGAILFGCIGTVIATNIASSSVNYTTSKNANVENVEDALDDLYDQIIGHPIQCYNGTCGKLSYRYWNDDFSNTSYASNALPTNYYATRELLVQNYGVGNFADNPVYIKSILINGVVAGHQVCAWNNNREFCLAKKSWSGTINIQDENAGIQTKLKLQRDIQETLGITIQNGNCTSTKYNVYCDFDIIRCGTGYDGNTGCNGQTKYCYVFGTGSAKCDVL